MPTFYFACRDTLVAQDENQATRIAYGKERFRVVSLAGVLIETSGSTLFSIICKLELIAYCVNN